MPRTTFSTLADVHEYVTTSLTRAVADGKHPWHWPVLASGQSGRVVVLRALSLAPFTWVFFTDRRSQKIQELTADSTCETLLYHPGHRTQLRLQGKAFEITELAERKQFWSTQQARSKRSYATLLAPGTQLSAPGSGLSASWESNTPTPEEDSVAFAHFAAYRVAIERYDFLQLGTEGQRRCTWSAQGGMQWLVP